jgi:hypothetical protein
VKNDITSGALNLYSEFLTLSDYMSPNYTGLTFSRHPTPTSGHNERNAIDHELHLPFLSDLTFLRCAAFHAISTVLRRIVSDFPLSEEDGSKAIL